MKEKHEDDDDDDDKLDHPSLSNSQDSKFQNVALEAEAEAEAKAITTTTARTRRAPPRTALTASTTETTATTATSVQKQAQIVQSLQVNPGTRAKEETLTNIVETMESVKRHQQALRLADTVANPYIHAAQQPQTKQEQSTVTPSMVDTSMESTGERLANIVETMESVKSRQKALRLADAVTNPYIHAQEETQTKQEKSTLVTDMSNPGMRAQEERLANTIDTMDSVKRRQQARRLADTMANPYMHTQEETKKKQEKSTLVTALSDPGMPVTEETLLNSVDSMELVKRHQQARKLEAIANPDLDAQVEIQSEQSDVIIFPGAVHVGSRLSDTSIFSAIRQGVGSRISGLLMGLSQDDDIISECSGLGSCFSANLVSESENDGEDEIVFAELVQKRSSRKVLIALSLILLIAVNLTLGIVYSRKKRGESIEPFTTKFDNDDKSNSRNNNNMSPENAESILQAVKDRGFIRCKPDYLEFTQNEGFTVDLCRAIAAAIFDDGVDGITDRTELSDVPFREQFAELWNGTLDISTASTTHTMVRDIYEPSTGLGIAFSTPFFYSGMKFAGIPTFVDCAERGDSLNGDCRGLSICVLTGSTHATTLDSILRGVEIYEGREIDSLLEMFLNKTCSIIASEIFHLKEQRIRDMGYEGEYSIGSKLFSNEPLAIASKGDDQEWADFCNWVLQALITADALDITQETALSSSLWSEATKGGYFPEVSSVFGDEHKNMFRNAIAAVGNYGELYDKYYEPIAPRSTATVNTINFGESGLLYSVPFGNLLIDESTLLTNIPPPRPILNGTLESIESVGVLRCGIIGNLPGFALLESNKETVEKRTWNGLDIEYCRAIAAALFSHSFDDDVDQDSFIEFVDVGSDEADGYVALDDDRIDIFVGGTITLSSDIRERMTGKGFTFSPPYFYYDTDGMMSNMLTGKKIGRSVVTRETDTQWSAFVRWISIALIYAEENDIKQEDAREMPVVELFGSQYLQMFRDAVLAVGNYGEMFDRTLEFPYNISRSGRNWINANGEPQFVPIPFI